MTYAEALQYLYDKLPIFQRVGAAAYKPGLENTYALMEMLGNPHKKLKYVHIAGTNGKGSSSHLIASILQAAGYKTGLYTSPHLKDFRERIRVNGSMIAEDEVCNFVSQHQAEIEKIQPSFFELCVALALKYFADVQVDIAVIEVGMGGRLDSTNIITPELCLITNIGYDHMQFLGDTLPKIAAEKAGIMKANVPTIISQEQEEVREVFLKRAEELQSKLSFADEQWEVSISGQAENGLLLEARNKRSKKLILCSALSGQYQQKNAAGVLAVIEQLQHQNWQISEDNIISGFRDVIKTTHLRGRWETLQNDPLVIADTGHNADGIKEILQQLSYLKYKHLHWVWGMVNDKDPGLVFKLLPKEATYYFCRPNIPRGLDATVCKEHAASFRLQGDAFASVKDAYTAALKASHEGDLVLIAGSTFVVAECL